MMAAETPAGDLHIRVEFGGGTELLFDNKRLYNVSLPAKYDPRILAKSGFANIEEAQSFRPTDVRYLIYWMLHYLLVDKARSDLFVMGETVRPGILVLINESDWELEGELDYVLQSQDSILFISTLHGG